MNARRNESPLAHAALLLTVIALSAFTPADASTTDCQDVRTGTTFSVPVVRYTATGTEVPDGSAVGALCIGTVRGTFSIPLADGSGGAFIAWIEAAGEDCDLRLQHVGSSGAPLPGWPAEGRPLVAAPGSQTQPALALGGAGQLWSAWRDYREPQQSAIYLTLLTESGEPLAGFPHFGIRVSGPAAQASDPQLVADAEGGAWLIWQQGGARAHRLWLKRFGADGSLLAGWPPEGRPLTAASSDAVHPIAAPDSAGLALMWVERSGSSSQLRLLRFDHDGVVAEGWPAAGGAIATSGGLLVPAGLLATPSGLLLTWGELFEDSSAAHAVRVERTGAISPGWPSGGMTLASVGNASYPAVCEDGQNGAYLSWIEASGSSGTVGVQLLRLNGGGSRAAGWPEGGVAVHSSTTGAYRPRLLPTEDGVVVSWSESEGDGDGALLNAAMASLGALPEFDRLETWPDLVRLAWRANGESKYVTLLERRMSNGDWLPVHELARDESGRFLHEDRDVAAGEVVTYRLRLHGPRLDVVTEEIRVEVPAAVPLALRGLSVSGGRLLLLGSVPTRAQSRFELFDVQGRRLLRDVRAHEHSGEIKLDWPVPDGVRAGVFFARFSQGRESTTRRFVLGR